ncbi:putative tRNA (guanine(26)-N(2))-dimethyltransferase [Helianthus debilis subsp. tardiflorus]
MPNCTFVKSETCVASVEACRRNIKFNGSVATAKVASKLVDARLYMLTHPKEFDMADLDPYGSPSVFQNFAIQSIADGGMLMCTATDMAVLCGGNGEVCYSKYGSYPLKAKYCHEMALRVLLACIENTSVRYLLGFGPVVPQECSDCGKKYNMGGPIWPAPIHDLDWVT